MRAEHVLRQVEDRMFFLGDVDPEQVDEVPGLHLELLVAGVTHRRTTEWIENQILHPEIMVKTDPIAHDLFAKFMLQMPNQKLTPEQAKDVIAFFRHKDHEAGEASK